MKDWHVMLSDLQDGDIEKLIDATDYRANMLGWEDCFGIHELFDGLNFWQYDCGFIESGKRLTREQALEKMGVEL